MAKQIFSGCQGKPQIKIYEKKCPNCGNEIEIFSIDTEAVCEKCGFKIYNDALNCAQWCKYAKQCVGGEMYEQLMKIAESQKQRREQEAAEKAKTEAEAKAKAEAEAKENA